MVSTPWLIVHFVVTFVAIAVLIVRFRLNPAISLLIGAIYLGLVTGFTPADLVAGLNEGFGGLMAEVGLLITMGVVMGFLMSSYGAIQRIVQAILRVFGRRGSPYAFSLTLATITPSIYFDVLLVLVAPIARRVARRTNRPMASLAGPVAMGLAVGNALVIPGAAMLAYLGAMGLSVSAMLVPGFLLAIPAVVLSTFLYLFIIEKLGWWNVAQDEDDLIDDLPDDDEEAEQNLPPLLLALAPIATALILVILGIVAPMLGWTSPVVGLLGDPVMALLIGALVALVICVARRGLDDQEDAVNRALETGGTILVVTAVAGALGQIIAGTGIRDVLATLFEATHILPLVVVWFVAAVMRTALGGQTVAGITAIGIIAPLVEPLGLSPVLVVLAAGAGGAFGGQFSDNAFWMLRSLFGLSTRGTLKTYTLAQSLLSMVALLMLLAVDLFV